MSAEIAHGRWPGLYFWGQSYGLAFVEAALAAPPIRALGATALALKAPMLLLWLGGALLLAQAGLRAGGRAGAVATLAVLLVDAGWASWSLKARGGYLTAWVLAGGLLALLGHRSGWRLRREGHALPAGALAAAIALAQPLWLLAVGPALAWAVGADRQPLRALLRVSAGAVLLFAALAPGGLVEGALGVGPSRAATTPGDGIFVLSDPSGAASALRGRVSTAGSGGFFMDRALDLGPWSSALGAAHAAGTLALLLSPFAALALGRRALAGALAPLAAGAALVLAFSVAIGPYAYGHRYLLPLSTLLAAGAGRGAVAWTWPRLRSRRAAPDATVRAAPSRAARAVAWACVLAAIGTAIPAFLEHRRLSVTGAVLPEDGRALAELIARLEAKGVAAVYSSSSLLPWTLVYLTEGRLPARWIAARDRVPWSVAAVERARAEGRRTAFVALTTVEPAALEDVLRASGVPPGGAVTVGGRYVVVLDPSFELLARVGFQR